MVRRGVAHVVQGKGKAVVAADAPLAETELSARRRAWGRWADPFPRASAVGSHADDVRIACERIDAQRLAGDIGQVGADPFPHVAVEAQDAGVGSHKERGGIGRICGGVPRHRHHGKIGQVADGGVEDTADFGPCGRAADRDAGRGGEEAMARAAAGAGLAVAGDDHGDALVVGGVDGDGGDVAAGSNDR